ncbi:MAG: hypothetical protein WCT47_22570 [Betaproteobacteria bacterium]
MLVGLLGRLLTLPALSQPFTMTLERLLEQFRQGDPPLSCGHE